MAVLVGPKGPAGPRGPQGLVGPRGPEGRLGPIGPAGRDGARGPTGALGPRGGLGREGPRGPRGDAGSPGQPGKDGSVIGIDHTHDPNDVGSAPSSGSAPAAAAYDHTHRGVRSVRAGVDPQLFGNVIFDAGSNISLAQIGNTITITSTGAGSLVFTNGITESGGTVTNDFFTGKNGGLTLYGGKLAGEDLTISSTVHATKGSLFFGSAAGMVYDEPSKVLSIGSLTAGGLVKAAAGTGALGLAATNTDFADPNAFYVVTKADVAPPHATNLGLMPSGLVRSTVALGVSTLDIDTSTYLTTGAAAATYLTISAAAATYQPILTSASGANLTSKFILQQPDAGAPNAQALSVLPTGILKSTTATGVVGIAAANTDFADPTAFYVVTRSDNAPSNAINLGGLTKGVLQQTVSGSVATVQAFTVSTGRIPYGATGNTGILKTDSSFRINESGGALVNLQLGNVNSTTTLLTVSDPTNSPSAIQPTVLIATFNNPNAGAVAGITYRNNLGASAPWLSMYLTSTMASPSSTFYFEASGVSGIVPPDVYFRRNDYGAGVGGTFNIAVVKNDGGIFWFNTTAAVAPAGTAGIRAFGNKLQYSENTGAWANFTDLLGITALTGDVTASGSGSVATTVNIPATRVPFGDGSGHMTSSTGLVYTDANATRHLQINSDASALTPSTFDLLRFNATAVGAGTVRLGISHALLGVDQYRAGLVSSADGSSPSYQVVFRNDVNPGATVATFALTSASTVGGLNQGFLYDFLNADIRIGTNTPLPVNSTHGFAWIGGNFVAGTPSGVPVSSAGTVGTGGAIPTAMQESTRRLYAYMNGAWHYASFDDGTAGAAAITALTGDVTASGPGSAATTITSNAVTLAKFQQIATNSLLGRSTAGTGNVEVITVGSGLTLSGGTLTSTGLASAFYQTVETIGTPLTQRNILNFSGAFVGVDNVGATRTDIDLAGGGVTYAKIQDVANNRILGNVSGGAHAPMELTSSDLSTLLGLAPIATSGSATNLTTGTVPAARFPAFTGDVTTIAGTVATTITNNAVTYAKIQTQADQTILGNNSGGVAVPSALTASQVRTLLGLAAIATSGSATDLIAGTLPAGRFPALTGDVTTIAGSFATTITANAVTFAKIQTIADQRLVGNVSGGVAVPAALTAAQVSTFLSLGTAATHAATDFEVPLTFTSGLSRSTNTVTNDLITGKSGGQTAVGDTAASGNLTLSSTTSGTKGKIVLGSTSKAYFDDTDGVLNLLGSNGDSIGGALVFGKAADQAIEKSGGVLYLATTDAHSVAFVTNGSSRGSFDPTGVFSVTNRIESGTFTGIGSSAVNIGGSGIVQSNGGGSVLTLQNAASPSTIISLSGSSINVTGTVSPSASLTYDLGSTSDLWTNVYAQTVSGNGGSFLTLQSDAALNPASSIFMTNGGLTLRGFSVDIILQAAATTVLRIDNTSKRLKYAVGGHSAVGSAGVDPTTVWGTVDNVNQMELIGWQEVLDNAGNLRYSPLFAFKG